MCDRPDLNKLGARILLILLAVVVSSFFVGGNVFANSAKSGEDCIDCHTDVWRSLQNKTYAHRPDRTGDCKCCHVPDRGGRGGGDGYLDKVKWVASAVSPGREHWLEFDRAKMGATLLVEMRSGKFTKAKELPLPTFDELEELPSSRMVPPTITNVRLQEVAKGVFVSATIAWDTDIPADSQVFYGFDKLDQSSTLDRQPVKEHVVTLTGVYPGRAYKLKVVSANLAGNRVESAVKNVFIEVGGSTVNQEGGNQNGWTDLDAKAKFYRRGANCFVVVSAERPVSVRLGVLPKKYLEISSGDQPQVLRHLPLNTPDVTCIGVCYTCHAEYKKILSHPVNVYPKRGMIIPPEYPTLPDGRISCMSCHADHASNIEFRLIKDRREELCRGCHRDIR